MNSNQKTTNTFTILIVLNLIVLAMLTSCSGLKYKLPDNCGKNEKITIAVLPFYNDEYHCHKNIETKIVDICYPIVDGALLVNEYCMSTNKKLEDISVDEFCEYAKTRGVDKIILGDVEVV
jgi:hypothetical protein